MTPECYQALHAHAVMLAPFECCGLVVADKYFPCRNVAEGADEFRIDPWDWKKAQDLGRVQAVCHSHPNSSSRPGPADSKGCDASGLPWFILGHGGLWRLDPAGTPLEGRPFVWGWSDCWSLVRDFFNQDMPDFPRTGEADAALYLQHYGNLGWHAIPKEEMQPGDVILMAIQGTGPDHAAVYVGNGQILHHMVGRLSRRELFDGIFQKSARMVLRRTA